MKPRYFLLAAALSTTVCMAQTPAFEELDLDGDGFLTEQEMSAARGIDFFDADTSKDGMVDAEEFKVALAPSGD